MRSRVLTFSSSPSNSSMKLAWVPVVPLVPRKRRVATWYSRFSMSIISSFIHSVARLPTVVSWAGWRWV